MGTPPWETPWTVVFSIAIISLVGVCNSNGGIRGPSFIIEPPYMNEFSNTTGTTLPCSATGKPNPTIEWMLADGTPADDVRGLRERQSDGSLLFYPFKAEDYRQDIHAVVYRCVASNLAGVVVSREAHLKAVMSQVYDIQVYDSYAIKGNTAIIRCGIPNFLTKYVTVSAWIRDSAFKIESSPLEDGKYVIMPRGDLYIRGVTLSDSGTSYRCQITHRLTGEVKQSTSSGTLFVTDPQGNVAPRIIDIAPYVTAFEGEVVILPCAAQGFPFPSRSWYLKGADGQLISVYLGERMVQMGSALVIKKTKTSDSGHYVCKIENNLGDDQGDIQLSVTAPLSVNITPSPAVLIPGKSLSLQCAVSGAPLNRITWLKDGQPIAQDSRILVVNEMLHIDNGKPEHKGMYQCFAANEQEMVQAEAEVIMGEIAPELTEGFLEKVVQPGEPLELTCVFRGNPPPNLTWTLNGMQLRSEGRFAISMSTDGIETMSSTLRIDGTRGEDGGEYGCEATNAAGKKRHLARINIHGNPGIHNMPKISVVAGKNLSLQCPYYGYPIHKVTWSKGPTELPVNLRQDVLPNGTLTIIDMERAADSGTYTCTVSNNEGQEASESVEIAVLIPPMIIPFTFLDDLFYKGMRAQVSCAVSQGDLPVQFHWLKDNQPIPQSLQIFTRDFDEQTSSLSIEAVDSRHSGNYTCIATNAAATSNYTAQLLVYDAPKIIPFSFQAEHLFEGVMARISCVVYQGDPPIRIKWLKDNRPIVDEMQIEIRSVDDYSSILTIPKVQPSHSGNYTCVAENNAARVNYTAPLTVNVPPRWTVEPNDTSAFPGDHVHIHCLAEGHPKPSITWLKVEGSFPRGVKKKLVSGHEYMILNNGTLYIPSVTEAHNSYYFCEAKNGIGQGVSKLVRLTVHRPVKFGTKSVTRTVKKGESLKLDCEPKGDRPIQVIWSINGQKIQQKKDSRYRIRETHSDEKFSSDLTINGAERKDSAKFSCSAKNAYGNAEKTFEVFVQEPPDPPSEVKILELKNRSVSLEWSSAFNGNSPITKYVLQFKESDAEWTDSTKTMSLEADQLTASLTSLKPAIKYQIRLFAENDIGTSERSEIVDIITAADAPSGPPEQVEVEPTDDEGIKVYWKPPKRKHWNGNIKGYYVGYRIAGSNEDFTYQSLDVPEDYTEKLSLTLSDLKRFTQYAVVVQAFNDEGRGPNSEEVLIMTSEDVPNEPPRDVRCNVLNSRSIHVTWQPPPETSVNGILRGYRVFYRPMEELSGNVIAEPKSVSVPKITLQGLQKFTNYTIQVLAFTKKGDGAKSEPVTCTTLEDVPEPPSDLKVLPSKNDSVILAWKPPKHKNGVILKYTIYVNSTKHKDQEQVIHVRGNVTSYEVTGLRKNDHYEFWVTAWTVLGEGQKSDIIIQSPGGDKIPARAASFDEVVTGAVNTDLQLPCKAVGSPPPQRKWARRGKPIDKNDRLFVLPDGSLTITTVQEKDAGNYTCKISNGYGEDQVVYTVVVLAPPGKPTLEVSLSTTTTLDVHWKLDTKGGSPILGYILHYKRDYGTWETVEVGPREDSYRLYDLICGTRYHLYLIAYNKVGQGEPSKTITANTKGTVPEIPLHESVIDEGPTFVTIRLDGWKMSSCPIQHFLVEHKLKGRNSWFPASDEIKPEQSRYVIRDLNPATWYIVRVTAYNSAGFSTGEYDFATRTLLGATVSPDSMLNDDMPIPRIFSLLDWRIIIPATASFIIILVVMITTCVCLNRSAKKKAEKRSKHRRKGERDKSKRVEEKDKDKPKSKRRKQEDVYVDTGFTYIQRTDSNKPSSSKPPKLPRRHRSEDDLAPYATVHLNGDSLTDLPSFGRRTSLSGNPSGSKRQTLPQLQPSGRPVSGSLGNISFASRIQQIPTAPPMSETYSGIPSMYPRVPSRLSNCSPISMRRGFLQTEMLQKKEASGENVRQGIFNSPSVENTMGFPHLSQVKRTESSEMTRPACMIGSHQKSAFS